MILSPSPIHSLRKGRLSVLVSAKGNLSQIFVFGQFGLFVHRFLLTGWVSQVSVPPFGQANVVYLLVSAFRADK